MRVLVAGSTGALGAPTVAELVAGNHEVFGLTRSRAKAPILEELGARAVVGDVLDGDAMRAVMRETRPRAVIQLLNALPKRGPMKPKDLEATNRLRIEGTRNVLEAAVEVGVRRFVAESMIFGYGYGLDPAEPITEDQPFLRQGGYEGAQGALDGLNSLEDQVRSATQRGDVEGVILRYGLFYGPGIGSTEFMISLLRKRLLVLPGGGSATGSWIHVADGAAAAFAALERAPAGSVYNVADDEPATLGDFATEMAKELGLPRPRKAPMWTARFFGKYAATMARSKLPVSNQKIKDELGWRPTYPTFREGIASLAANGADSDDSPTALAS